MMNQKRSKGEKENNPYGLQEIVRSESVEAHLHSRGGDEATWTVAILVQRMFLGVAEIGDRIPFGPLGGS